MYVRRQGPRRSPRERTSPGTRYPSWHRPRPAGPPAPDAPRAICISNCMHSYECSLSCMKKAIRPSSSRRGWEELLAAADSQVPSRPELVRDQPSRFLARRNHSATLALPMLGARGVGKIRKSDAVQAPAGVRFQGRAGSLRRKPRCTPRFRPEPPAGACGPGHRAACWRMGLRFANEARMAANLEPTGFRRTPPFMRSVDDRPEAFQFHTVRGSNSRRSRRPSHEGAIESEAPDGATERSGRQRAEKVDQCLAHLTDPPMFRAVRLRLPVTIGPTVEGCIPPPPGWVISSTDSVLARAIILARSWTLRHDVPFRR